MGIFKDENGNSYGDWTHRGQGRTRDAANSIVITRYVSVIGAVRYRGAVVVASDAAGAAQRLLICACGGYVGDHFSIGAAACDFGLACVADDTADAAFLAAAADCAAESAVLYDVAFAGGSDDTSRAVSA